ncbi:hypothetical protein TNCV_3774161 [Trichonephila clavipes]|nr:hypothetical protein TNCV_3774161 [Trichonephila clavipes]
MGSNPGEGMDVCKCLIPLRQGGTLNSRGASSPLVNLVEGEERLGGPSPSLECSPLNIGVEPSKLVLSPAWVSSIAMYKLGGGSRSRKFERERIIGLREGGFSCHAIAAREQRNSSPAMRVWKKWTDDHPTTKKKTGNGQKKVISARDDSLVVRGSDSRPEGLDSMHDATKHPPSTHGVRAR